VRATDARRDGAAVADLLEISFKDEGIDDNGQRMIRMLRSYGLLEALIMEGAPGFVWIEDGLLLGNASVQRNPTRRDTWIVGNVATHPAHRNRSIGAALMGAVVQFARVRGARGLALQVVEGNGPALHLYEKFGFRTVGAVTYYQRPSVRVQPVRNMSIASALSDGLTIRGARWADRANVWRAARENIPPDLTYAEAFDAGLYQLGLRWSLGNWFSGNPEQWWIAERAASASPQFVGAARARVNYDLAEHHVELLLSAEASARASAADGARLLARALKHFEIYTGKPLLATQSRPHEATHAALQDIGFQPLRTLLHMRLDLRS
jgi:GNAT superfamily N-acetyltransferase